MPMLGSNLGLPDGKCSALLSWCREYNKLTSYDGTLAYLALTWLCLQVTGIPVVFISALEGRGRMVVMRQVIDTYEKWCLRLSTARLNRWLRKVMSRHSWKDQAAQPKIKYFTQVKARPPTFVAFVSGKMQLSDTDLRFLTRSLKEDFDLGGIPIRIMQRSDPRKYGGSSSKSSQSSGRIVERTLSDKRSVVA